MGTHGIEDLSLDPPPNQLAFLSGYLGVTDSLSCRGILSFTALKTLRVRQIRVSFAATLSTTLHVPPPDDNGNGNGGNGGTLKRAKKNQFKEVEQSHTLFAQDVVVLEPESDLEGVRGKKKGGVVFLEDGSHEFKFSLTLPREILASLPPSLKTSAPLPAPYANSKEVDEASIVYTLTATLELANSGLFGGVGSKTKSVRAMDEVDVPRVDSQLVMTAAAGQMMTVLAPGGTGGVTRDDINGSASAMGEQALQQTPHLPIDYQIVVDRTAFGIAEPVRVTLTRATPTSKSITIKSWEASIRQIQTLRSSTTTTSPPSYERTIEHTIATSEKTKLKPLNKPNKSGGDLPHYDGTLVLSVSSIRQKGVKNATRGILDILPSVHTDLITVSHVLDVVFTVENTAKKGSSGEEEAWKTKEVRATTPVVFYDADEATRKSILKIGENERRLSRLPSVQRHEE
ncbi:hypothetical protein HK102_000860 [Quaeritorhiza haematococci]|nr:hypothetical protein HK102_000860 [Quaeritorhiza haematococci]